MRKKESRPPRAALSLQTKYQTIENGHCETVTDVTGCGNP